MSIKDPDIISDLEAALSDHGSMPQFCLLAQRAIAEIQRLRSLVGRAEVGQSYAELTFEDPKLRTRGDGFRFADKPCDS